MRRARDNPFCVDRIAALDYHPPDMTWPHMLARLEALRFRGAIVGPCGSGKTTLLRTLADRLAHQGLRTARLFVSIDIRPSRRTIRNTLKDPFDVLLLDGADHLHPLRWWAIKRAVFRRGRGLVITTHRPGRLPTWVVCRTDPTLLGRLVSRLAYTPSSGSAPWLHDPAFLERLYDQCGGNLRDALRHLYDRMATDRSA